MLFNSIEFFFFLPVCLFGYHILNRGDVKFRNLFLILVGYIFYGWWSWKFLILLFISTLVDYLVGIAIGSSDSVSRKRFLLSISLTAQLGMLLYYKYANFFIESFSRAFTFLGYHIDASRLDIVLPVGISFYTFQTLSYTIDVYRGKIQPVRSFVNFCSFVSFFPQLVAGPIERASQMLPQFEMRRTISGQDWSEGCKQMLWGFFKKLAIADNCAVLVNELYGNHAQHSGATLFFAAVLFSFQIYCDFSGYSDIAIGSARLFGFNLMQNFAYPYFSKDIAEFWRRWHISLSTWFRDYLYFPLGGSRGDLFQKVRNTFIVFMVSGFWHGANLTFLIWGFLHSLFYLPLLLTGTNKVVVSAQARPGWLSGLKDASSVLGTFLLVCLAWVFFRAPSVQVAFSILSKILSKSLFQFPVQFSPKICVLILVLIGFEWLGRAKKFPLEDVVLSSRKPVRWMIYLALILSVYFLGNNDASIEFIYFQF